MHKQLSDKLSALLTTAMRDAIRSQHLDPARVPFKVHVAERAVNGVVFLGVSFQTLHREAPIRAAFWDVPWSLPCPSRPCSSFERSIDVPVVLPGAEHMFAVQGSAVLRALLGEERYGALTVEDVHLLLGTYEVERWDRKGLAWWRVTLLSGQAKTTAFKGALYQSEAVARNAVAARCERLFEVATITTGLPTVDEAAQQGACGEGGATDAQVLSARVG